MPQRLWWCFTVEPVGCLWQVDAGRTESHMPPAQLSLHPYDDCVPAMLPTRSEKSGLETCLQKLTGLTKRDLLSLKTGATKRLRLLFEPSKPMTFSLENGNLIKHHNGAPFCPLVASLISIRSSSTNSFPLQGATSGKGCWPSMVPASKRRSQQLLQTSTSSALTRPHISIASTFYVCWPHPPENSLQASPQRRFRKSG